MKNLKKKNTLFAKKIRAFTLIELLIVIALLGALAVGLLAALDPFEQLKKGTDTGVRNTVSEIHGAFIRYYAIKNEMPWGLSVTAISSLASDSTFTNYINSVINTGELKQDFFKLAGNQLSTINVVGTPDSMTVCFQPKSKSFRSDSNTKYDSSGVEVPGVCPNGNSSSSYWCVR